MPPILQMLAWAASLVLFSGASVVYLRGSRDKGTIATLTANNEALTERVAILEADRVRDQAEKTGLADRVSALERENDVLVGLANSREAIASLNTQVGSLMDSLADALASHHAQAMAGVTQIHGDLMQLLDTTRDGRTP